MFRCLESAFSKKFYNADLVLLAEHLVLVRKENLEFVEVLLEHLWQQGYFYILHKTEMDFQTVQTFSVVIRNFKSPPAIPSLVISECETSCKCAVQKWFASIDAPRCSYYSRFLHNEYGLCWMKNGEKCTLMNILRIKNLTSLRFIPIQWYVQSN